MDSNIKIAEISNTIKDLIVFKPDIFYDFRGENMESFNPSYYEKISEHIPEFKDKLRFTTDSFSFSTKHTLRGFHGDAKCWKLIQCLKGSVHLVVIDSRIDSPTFKQHTSFNLNDKNRTQVLVPKGCVNAHLCLSDECIFGYKLTESYVCIKDQIHVKWNDPEYSIYWPIKSPILSIRDR